MNIGEALKQYRTNAGLTQKEFTQNILSPAHYSKIERNLHEISANDLLKLLSQNKIRYSDFFSSLDQNNVNDQDENLVSNYYLLTMIEILIKQRKSILKLIHLMMIYLNYKLNLFSILYNQVVINFLKTKIKLYKKSFQVLIGSMILTKF